MAKPKIKIMVIKAAILMAIEGCKCARRDVIEDVLRGTICN
jgi:hypothetical protein